jgi:PAS domain S-box-containing protein
VSNFLDSTGTPAPRAGREELGLEGFARLAALISEAPIALIHWTDGNHDKILASHGFSPGDPSEAGTLIRRALKTDVFYCRDDADLDSDFSRHAWVTGAPYIRFLTVLKLDFPGEGSGGALIVAGPEAAELGQNQQEALRLLGAEIERRLERVMTGNRTPEIAAAPADVPGPTEGERTAELVRSNDELQNRLVDLHRAKQALAEEHNLLRTVIDNVPEHIYVKDADRKFVLDNWAHAQAIGLKNPKEIFGRTVFDLHPNDLATKYDRDDLGIIRTGKPLIDFEEPIQDFEGKRRWCLTTKIPLYDADGKLIGIVGVGRDITSRKQAEKAMKDSEERLRLALEAARMCTWELDIGTGVIVASQGTELLYGQQGQAHPRALHDLLELIYADDRARAREKMETAMKKGAAYEAEFRVLWPDGSLHWLSSIGRAYTDEQGRGTRLSSVVMDISERKRSEEQIREQAALLDKARDAILVTDLQHRIAYWNKSAEQLYGRTSEEAFGHVAHAILNKEESLQSRQAQRQFLDKGEWMGELRQVTKAGREITVESRWSLIRDEAGKSKGVLILNTDVTEKKRLEAQFFRAQRMESIGTLAGGIAHDLNNVLAPILMAIQLLRQKLSGERDQRLLDLLENNAQRGAGMVKQVLCFARGMDGERAVLQLRHLVAEMERIALDTFPCSIQITCQVPKELWTILGDATQLHQVLMNLCVNARDAMPSGGKLSITCENVRLDEHYARLHMEAKPGPFVVLTIADTGSGISQNLVDKIFEPFFTTKELGKGTGLGLSTVLSIVKSHGGFVNVYSEVGRGSEFKVYLPAADVGEITRSETTSQTLFGHGELLLVADDEISVREIMKSALEASGFRVLCASDGTEAVALYAQNRDEVALVITDMSMPFLDGPATIRALRKLNPDLNILAISGLMEKEKIAEVSDTTRVAFLHKPYTTAKLLTVLKDLLPKKDAPAGGSSELPPTTP